MAKSKTLVHLIIDRHDQANQQIGILKASLTQAMESLSSTENELVSARAFNAKLKHNIDELAKGVKTFHNENNVLRDELKKLNPQRTCTEIGKFIDVQDALQEVAEEELNLLGLERPDEIRPGHTYPTNLPLDGIDVTDIQ